MLIYMQGHSQTFNFEMALGACLINILVNPFLVRVTMVTAHRWWNCPACPNDNYNLNQKIGNHLVCSILNKERENEFKK